MIKVELECQKSNDQIQALKNIISRNESFEEDNIITFEKVATNTSPIASSLSQLAIASDKAIRNSV